MIFKHRFILQLLWVGLFFVAKGYAFSPVDCYRSIPPEISSDLAVKVCSGARTDFRSKCFEKVVYQGGRNSLSPEEAAEFCKDVETEYPAECFTKVIILNGVDGLEKSQAIQFCQGAQSHIPKNCMVEVFNSNPEMTQNEALQFCSDPRVDRRLNCFSVVSKEDSARIGFKSLTLREGIQFCSRISASAAIQCYQETAGFNLNSQQVIQLCEKTPTNLNPRSNPPQAAPYPVAGYGNYAQSQGYFQNSSSSYSQSSYPSSGYQNGPGYFQPTPYLSTAPTRCFHDIASLGSISINSKIQFCAEASPVNPLATTECLKRSLYNLQGDLPIQLQTDLAIQLCQGAESNAPVQCREKTKQDFPLLSPAQVNQLCAKSG